MKKLLKCCKGSSGFTLMELMIVIAIIIILSGAIVSRVSTSGERAKLGKATQEAEEIATACRAYYADTGVWPKDLNPSLVTAPANPNALATGYDESGAGTSTGTGASKAPYLEIASGDTPKDPWGVDYIVDIRQVNSKNFLYVISTGLDKTDDGVDTSSGKAKGDDVAILVHRFN